MNKLTPQQQRALDLIERTADQFFSKEDFIDLLTSGKKLRIKFGVDVTAPTIHIGNAVNMWMMRAMQDLGHKVIFLIGDFTTRIGDPTGRDKKRPVITNEEIQKNAEAFIDQAKMVLRFDDPDLLEVRHNSEWLENIKLHEFLNLSSLITHARLISRDMFQKRIESETEIHMHELLYPILQGYDSFALESDLTIIGSDQLFNEMLGKTYQEKLGQRPQTIITSIITPGLDGGEKQSKSLGNYVGLAHTPRDKFGRIMRLLDNLIEEYFIIYTDLLLNEIEDLKPMIKQDPLQAKQKLAQAIVARYHGKESAQAELDWWQTTFSKKETPDDIEEVQIKNEPITMFDLVKLCLQESVSNADIKRLFKQGAIQLNDEKIGDFNKAITIPKEAILKAGKRRWFKITT